MMKRERIREPTMEWAPFGAKKEATAQAKKLYLDDEYKNNNLFIKKVVNWFTATWPL